MKMQSVKSLCLAIGVAALGLAFSAGAAHAQDRQAGPYIHGDVSAFWIQDVRGRVGGERVRLEFDPGIRFSIGAGYRIYPGETLGIGFELDTGFTWNSFDRIKVGGQSASLSGDYYQVPFIANVVFNLEPAPGWVLYLGGGGGGIYGRGSIDRIDGIRVRFRDDDVDGVAQALGGLRYEITDRASVGLGFKFMNVFASGIQDPRMHSIGLSYNLSF